MKTINCFILDDEIQFLDTISLQIKNIFFEQGYQAIIHSYSFPIGVEAICFCDVYFLDINLPQTNGIDYAQQIIKQNKNALIIFITSNKELVYQCFDVHPFDFIVKGLPEKNLKRKIGDLVKLFNRNYYTIIYQSQKFDISIESIIYIEKDKNYCNIFTIDNKVFRSRITIKQFQFDLNQLVPYFIKTNESTLVNANYIISLNKEIIHLNNSLFLKN